MSGRREHGFTLLEVLVSLVIISLGIVGVFNSLNQMLSATSRLRDKTLATWIAADRIAELRITGEIPKTGDSSDEIEMAGATWAYTIKTAKIPDMEMRRLDVTVTFADLPNDILATVVGFLDPIAAEAGRAARAGQANEGGEQPGDLSGFGSGWEPLDPNVDYASGETE